MRLCVGLCACASVLDGQSKVERVRRGGALLRLCGHVLMRDDVIPTSCAVAAVAACLHLAARYTSHLLLAGPALQLTGMAAAVSSLRSQAVGCAECGGTVDLAALDAWYRRHMTFEIVNLAGVLQHFADGRTER